MKNYPKFWRQLTRFKEIKYNDFISEELKYNRQYIISPKYDGMLCAIIYDGNDVLIQTKTGRLIEDDLPIKNEIINFLKNKKVNNAIFIGELVAIVNNTILPFNKTQSIVKTPNIGNNSILIHVFIFDVIYFNDKLTNKYKDSIQILLNIFSNDLPHVHIPQFFIGKFNKIRDVYKQFMNTVGFDGIVVRESNSMNAIKIKYKSTLDVAIIGFGNKKMKSWPRNEISYLLTAFMDNDGYFRVSSKVGTGFNKEMRKKLFTMLNEIKIYETDEEVFVEPKYVIEVEYLEDMISMTDKLKFNGKKYIKLGTDKSITLRHPSFIRIREDKEVNKYDIRIEQSPLYRIK